MAATRKNSNFGGASRIKSSKKVKSAGKRIGKSKPAKANNQLNRRVK